MALPVTRRKLIRKRRIGLERLERRAKILLDPFQGGVRIRFEA
jgi:hypothetical protein